MAEMFRRAKTHGFRVVSTGESRDTHREVGKLRKTDGTMVGATTGILLSENYNTVRVDVSIIIPTTYERKKEAMEEVWEFLEDELASKAGAAKKLLEEL